jgi:hypothetical protein
MSRISGQVENSAFYYISLVQILILISGQVEESDFKNIR